MSATNTDWCDFLKGPYDQRRKRKGYKEPAIRPEGYGEPSGEHPLVRCPKCNRRLKLKAAYCIGGEFVNWRLPKHKPRVTRKPGPRRKAKVGGRGK